MGEVARRYSWPPAEAGNVLALRHGAFSPRSVQPIADGLAEHLVDVAPWCASPAFGGAVRSWAWGEAQLALLRSYVDEHGHLDDEGEPRPAVALAEKVESKLAKAREALGLTPTSLGKLLATAASVASATGDGHSLEALRAEGLRLLETHGEAPE